MATKKKKSALLTFEPTASVAMKVGAETALGTILSEAMAKRDAQTAEDVYTLGDPAAPGAPAVVPTHLCRYCQKWYPKSSILPFGNGLERCEKCNERHEAALDMLAGKPPTGCGMCEITWAKLNEITPGDKIHMRVIMVDGTYVIACGTCYAHYVKARRELYKGTKFGADHKL